MLASRRVDREGDGSFLANGLAGSPLRTLDRTLHLTVDFEAFTPAMAEVWWPAMRRWAIRVRSLGLPCDFFVSLEHIFAARAAGGGEYDLFRRGLQRLCEAGCRVHGHNHRVFDPESGRVLAPAGAPKLVSGYPKQASLGYDVLHRHHYTFADWFEVLFSCYYALCADIDVPPPERLAFRPGGWDCGVERKDQADYLAALATQHVALHSGDSHGRFGTHGYRVGSEFGHNVYRLSGGLLELAPCWSLHGGGASAIAPQSVGALGRLLRDPVVWKHAAPGAFVVVLHFDHLFHRGWRRSLQEFSETSESVIDARIDRVLELLSYVSRTLSLRPALLEEALPTDQKMLAVREADNGSPGSLVSLARGARDVAPHIR